MKKIFLLITLVIVALVIGAIRVTAQSLINLSVCVGGTVSAPGSGTGSSSFPSVAVVDGTGTVTGISPGSAIINYSGVDVYSVTVNPNPPAITGTTRLCMLGTTTLHDFGGGTWSSMDGSGSATVTAGSVYGVAVGTATISYILSTSCYASIVVTVGALPTISYTGAYPTVAFPDAELAFSTTGSPGLYSITWNTPSDFVNVTDGILPSSPLTFTLGSTHTNGVYTGSLTVQDAAGCVSSPAMTVTVDKYGSTAGSDPFLTTGCTVCPGPNQLTFTHGFEQSMTLFDASAVSIDAMLATTSGNPATETDTWTINSMPSHGTLSGFTSSGGVLSASAITAGGAATPSGLTYIPDAGYADGTTDVFAVTVDNGVDIATTTVIYVTLISSGFGDITGNNHLCVGLTSQLTDVTPGGTWSSSNVNATVNSVGLVTGVTEGISIISYTISATVYATMEVTVGPVPTIAYTGGVPLSASAPTLDYTTTNSPYNYTILWQGAAATYFQSVTDGVLPGIPITFDLISAGSPPPDGTYTGLLTVKTSPIGCVSDPPMTVTVVKYTAGGIDPYFTSGCTTCPGPAHLSFNAGFEQNLITCENTPAPINAMLGVTSTNTDFGITDTWTVQTNPSNGSLTGFTFSPGSLSTSAPAISGAATPIDALTYSPATDFSGTDMFSIYASNGVDVPATAIVYVNVLPSPVAGTITGPTAVCSGATIGLTDAASGGTWSSSAGTIASVSSAGVVTGLTPGTATISYTATNSCGTAYTTYAVTVNPATSAGSISGPSAVSVGGNITLSDGTAGGTWSANNGHATVSGGVVNGVSAGSVTISYTVGGVCGSASATKLVSVGTSTVTISAISGYYFYVCAGANATFWDATPGGSWSMTPAGTATVSATGIVTGISPGTATLVYTYLGSSVTSVVTVYATPATISGGSSICVGSTTSLSDVTPGGAWSSTSLSTAAISTSGVVTGLLAGTTTIYYTTPTAGCKAALVVNVTTAPSPIGGATSVCAGSAISLSDHLSGGTWSSTGPASVAGMGSGTALVTGVSAGTATITYSFGTSCYKTYAVTVKAIPNPISGNLAVCGVGAVTFLSDATTGSSWTISPVGTATISPSGRIYGVSTGTATVTYTATNTCIITATATVNALVTAASISGLNNVSHGATISLSDITAGGTWTSSNSAMGSVDAAGNVTGVGVSGSVVISYTVPYAGGTCNANAMKTISVHTPAPHSHAGSAITSVGASVNLADEAIGGDWASSDNTIATVDGSGTVSGIETGNANIIHTVASSDGSVTTTITQLIVRALPFEVKLMPNPNKGVFTVSGTTGSGNDEAVSLEVTNMLGQVVYTDRMTTTGGTFNAEILLNSSLANGMYLLHVSSGSEHKVFHFIIER